VSIYFMLIIISCSVPYH